jgi:hypothetical protein
VNWTGKYQTGDAVTVLYAAPDEVELSRLVQEKARNAAGLLITAEAERAGLSLASFGRELGESALAREVVSRYPKVDRIYDKERFPQQIDSMASRSSRRKGGDCEQPTLTSWTGR